MQHDDGHRRGRRDDNAARGWSEQPSGQAAWGGPQGGGYGRQHHDPDYHQWREQQIRKLDSDYDSWRGERYSKFSEDFDKWRAKRSAGGSSPGTGSTGSSSGASAGGNLSSGTSAGTGSGTGDTATGKER